MRHGSAGLYTRCRSLMYGVVDAWWTYGRNLRLFFGDSRVDAASFFEVDGTLHEGHRKDWTGPEKATALDRLLASTCPAGHHLNPCL